MSLFTAAILAGGQSRRMGHDKAEIKWQGETMLARTARVAQEAAMRVIVIGRDRPDDWLLPEVEFLRDRSPGSGPLGGLVTALETAGPTPIIALACDMPRLDADALRWLLVQKPNAHGIAVHNDGHWEPLFSIYLPTILPLARQRLSEGRRSLYGLIEMGNFASVQAPPEITASLVNVNTPEELAQILL